jgi:hypothetical protein
MAAIMQFSDAASANGASSCSREWRQHRRVPREFVAADAACRTTGDRSKFGEKTMELTPHQEIVAGSILLFLDTCPRNTARERDMLDAVGQALVRHGQPLLTAGDWNKALGHLVRRGLIRRPTWTKYQELVRGSMVN